MFSTESKFYQALTILWDIMFIGLLWTVFSLPIITIGASTTALYYVATKKVTNRESSYMIKDFWHSFKDNIVKSTIVFLILAVVGFSVSYNLLLLSQAEASAFGLLIRLVIIFVGVQLLFVTSTIFAVIARFDLKIGEAFKTSFALANKHLFSTISNIIMFLTVWYLAFRIPVILLFMMGIYAYFSSMLLVRMFRKNNVEFEAYIEANNPETFED